MASKLNRGFIRIGILLSIVWIIVVAGTAAHEAGDRREFCAMTPTLGHCRHFFYTWQSDNGDGARGSDADESAGGDDRKKAERLLLDFGKVMLKVETGQPPVYRLNAENLILALFAPLLALWALGFGLAWCAAGFKENK